MAICSMAASSFSGMIANSIVHPLDTIKIRMQLGDSSLTSRNVAKNLIKKEGIRAFWKGVLQPIYCSIPVNVVGFTATEYTRTKMQTTYPDIGIGARNLIAGCFGGGMSCFVYVTPELLKARAQMTQSGQLSYRKEL